MNLLSFKHKTKLSYVMLITVTTADNMIEFMILIPRPLDSFNTFKHFDLFQLLKFDRSEMSTSEMLPYVA